MNNQKSEIKPVEGSKKFKVINVPRKVLEAATGQIKCVCDNCLASPDDGYYVAVLNRWFCPTCYKHWVNQAEYYEEDAWVEEKNYNRYMELFKKVMQ